LRVENVTWRGRVARICAVKGWLLYQLRKGRGWPFIAADEISRSRCLLVPLLGNIDADDLGVKDHIAIDKPLAFE
jgi:hypothetical protein